jgi:glycosyltransferase involved in cell wall biosynthesis
MKRTSIIIRCYNEEAHIGRLLSGIMQQNQRGLEVIVVDSGSTDATLSIAAQYPVKLLHIDKESFSFGRSLNFGCEAATGDFLVFASAHVFPLYRDWTEQIVRPFADERVACVYGKQRGNEHTKFSEHQIFSKWFPADPEPNQVHPFCNNANAAIRRSVWEQIRYDQTLTGLEDLDWAKKVISAGYRITYCPDAEVVHVHDETPKQILNRYRREAIAMKAIFPHERFSFLNFVHMYVTNTFSDARVALGSGMLGREFVSILVFRLMQFWGTYRGYSQHGPVSKALRSKFYYPNDTAGAAPAREDGEAKRPLIDYSADNRAQPGD